MGLREKYIVTVAPAQPAQSGRPSVGETLRNILAKVHRLFRNLQPWPCTPGHPKVHAFIKFLVDVQDQFADLEGISTLYEAFQHSLRTYPNNRCLGRRSIGGEFQWDSYKVQCSVLPANYQWRIIFMAFMQEQACKRTRSAQTYIKGQECLDLQGDTRPECISCAWNPILTTQWLRSTIAIPSRFLIAFNCRLWVSRWKHVPPLRLLLALQQEPRLGSTPRTALNG